MIGLKTLIQAHKFKLRLEKEVDPMICVTELVRCVTALGKPFYAYIRIKPSEYIDYKIKLDKGETIDPNQYEILEYDWGVEPPAHTRERMEEQFGVDHDFESRSPYSAPPGQEAVG